ncbi:MAG: flagellar hook-length control protein-like, C-terminal domain-containing protein, partial [bacterium]
VAVASGPATGPADLLSAAAARDAAGEIAEDGEPTPDPTPPGEGPAAQAQGPAATRETGVSQLSRATIEATAQIAAQILRRLEGRSTRFEMALTPDELGRVDVKLDIDAEGRLNARLAFDNPAAATDLRGRADELRRQLEDAGFHLAADAFEFAERDSGSSAFDRGQDTRHGSSRAFAAASRLNSEIDVAQPPRWLALSLSPSGVDMKV